MFYRFSPIILFAVSVGALIWDAWFRENPSGDAGIGEAYFALYASAAWLRPRCSSFCWQATGRSTDTEAMPRWLVIGFWLQR
jgi:hypothetical protein